MNKQTAVFERLNAIGVELWTRSILRSSIWSSSLTLSRIFYWTLLNLNSILASLRGWTLIELLNFYLFPFLVSNQGRWCIATHSRPHMDTIQSYRNICFFCWRLSMKRLNVLEVQEFIELLNAWTPRNLKLWTSELLRSSSSSSSSTKKTAFECIQQEFNWTSKLLPTLS